MENKITLVIGGCRSGKSTFALNQANDVEGDNKFFIATSVPTDNEMERRVEKHKLERGEKWHTVEEPVHLHAGIETVGKRADVILVDCLTLWISNLMASNYDQEKIETAVEKLERTLIKSNCPVFLVSNEVGTGIVPENLLARQFRDFSGYVNQRIAKAADRVVMVVAGIDVQIKPRR